MKFILTGKECVFVIVLVLGLTDPKRARSKCLIWSAKKTFAPNHNSKMLHYCKGPQTFFPTLVTILRAVVCMMRHLSWNSYCTVPVLALAISLKNIRIF